jgi:hypothetical protein
VLVPGMVVVPARVTELDTRAPVLSVYVVMMLYQGDPPRLFKKSVRMVLAAVSVQAP